MSPGSYSTPLCVSVGRHSTTGPPGPAGSPGRGKVSLQSGKGLAWAAPGNGERAWLRSCPSEVIHKPSFCRISLAEPSCPPLCKSSLLGRARRTAIITRTWVGGSAPRCHAAQSLRCSSSCQNVLPSPPLTLKSAVYPKILHGTRAAGAGAGGRVQGSPRCALPLRRPVLQAGEWKAPAGLRRRPLLRPLLAGAGSSSWRRLSW